MATRKPLAEKLRPASFRSVPFQVEATDLGGVGRRTQLHEYPQRDKPFVEDLGRATRDLSFDAFVVGDDYVEQANKLLGALEQAGPGALVHPWFGSLTVSIKEPGRVTFNAQLGYAHFVLSFYESGELAFPKAEESTQAQSRQAASELEVAAVESFASKFSIKGFQDFVAAAANGGIGDMFGIVSSSQVGSALGYANRLASSLNTALSFVSSPKTLGYKILGAFGLSGLTTTGAAWSSVARGLARLVSGGSLKNPSAPTIYTPSRQQVYTNGVALNSLARQTLIAQAVGATSLVDTPADTSSAPTYEDMKTIRDAVVSAIDSEMLVADDIVYPALLAARLAVWKDLTARARDNARLDTITPPEVLPALVVAYEYYEDASRSAEIVARNGIRHPGFLAPVPLKVLTR